MPCQRDVPIANAHVAGVRWAGFDAPTERVLGGALVRRKHEKT